MSKIGSAWRSPETEEEDDDDGADSEDEDGGVAGEGPEGDEEEVVRTSCHHHQRGGVDGADEIWPIRRLYKGVHLTLNLEAASLLPVVLR